RIREGAATVEHNKMIGNRFGLQVADAVFGRFNRNLMTANIETGLALRNTDNIETSANAIVGNGINGLIIREARGTVTGNFIADNGERGIGIQSFIGQIKANTIVDNGLYGIGLEGKDDIAATGNWWGDSNLDKEIFDHHDDLNLGLVTFEPRATAPLPFAWPTAEIPVNLTLSNEITVTSTITVPQGATLAIKPGATIRFAPEAGMNILGRIEAGGTKEHRITFAPLDDHGPSSWGEIKMERAMGSFFTNCDFSKATWALHSHFVDLKVSHCQFDGNDGGIRINNGPVDISQSRFRNNRIGFRSFQGIATIHNNEFTGNETAIFVREKGSGTIINHNNLTDNGMYAIRLGDFNDEDVDARHNWWGGKPVLDQVFDGHREEYIGTVLFDPELKAPITLDWSPTGGDRP
ncbi:MAG: right-handed parallel beta-helix repeat-containing protein, partial [Desulfobulbaceae bacterium]|nr:right-handed parallel beta-helix repeat-containing protein [Desulfobulbaceae bacterium]